MSKPVNAASAASPPWLFGFEYRSSSTLWGLPLIHIATGYNPNTGLPRLACGVIAIGNFAIGIIAVGGVAVGCFVLSGIGLGIGVLAGIAIGWSTIGGIAIGAVFALGGLAVSFGNAIGGLPLLLYLGRVSSPLA
jgi:hypothetical protein